LIADVALPFRVDKQDGDRMKIQSHIPASSAPNGKVEMHPVVGQGW